MKYKSNKGVTLLALTVTIIVILIIAGITITGGSRLIQEAKVEDVKTNMLLLQAEVKNFIEQAKFEGKKIEDLVGTGVKVDDDTLILQEAKDIQGTMFYKIISPKLSDVNLGKLDANVYLIKVDIDKIDVDVYYTPGIDDGYGTTYNLLSEMQ